MEIGAASALSLYTFQANAKASGQSAAVVEALSQTYTDSMSAAGSDAMAGLLTASSMAPVVDAMYSLVNSGSSGSGKLSAESLLAYMPVSGVNAASASALFSSGASSTTASGVMRGFDSALNATSTLALSAYQANKTYSAPTALAQAKATTASEPTATDVQQALQNAQAATFASTLNLFA